VIDALVDLHAIDVAAHGLGWLGQPRGFVRRQVRGWTERWHRSKTSAVPEMDEVTAWLEAHVPPDPAAPSIVHGDFKLDNVMLDAGDPGRVVAVLDWEMSALGDPLVAGALAGKDPDLVGEYVARGIEENQLHILTDALELENLDYSEFEASFDSMTLALASHLSALAPYRER